MSVDPKGPSDPVPSEFVGNSAADIARRMFHATRPKFFPASILPVLAGTAWGVIESGQFDFSAFTLALIATVCVHAGSNVINDIGDEWGGTDRQNTTRIYPYTGGSRFIQNNIIDISGMVRLGISLLGIAAIVGFVLFLMKGVMILAFGITGVVLGVFYSVGPIRLSSNGLGELAVAITFGIIPVTGAAWLQSGVIDDAAILFSVPISAWVAAILLINEVPDIEADAATGKRTLPVRLGNSGTAMLYIAINIVALAAVVLLIAKQLLPLVAVLVPIGLVILALKAAGTIRQGLQNRCELTRAIESTLAIHAIGALWLAASVLFALFLSS